MKNPKQLGAVLVAMALVTASAGVQAGKDNGGGGQHGNPGMASGAVPGNGQAYGHGTNERSDSQYQQQYQHQHRSRQHGSDNVWSSGPETGEGNAPYSDDRRLSQRDFQTWLGQGENANKQAVQKAR